MNTVSLRKQGGAAIMTIPPHVLKGLNVTVGSQMALEVVDHKLVASPVELKPVQKRYSLQELLQGVTPKKLKQLNQATAWAREGKPEGREIA